MASTQSQDAVGQDAALKNGVGSCLMKRGNSAPGPASVWATKLAALLLHQPIQRGLLGAEAFAVERGTIGRQLGLPADGLHARFSKW